MIALEFRTHASSHRVSLVVRYLVSISSTGWKTPSLSDVDRVAAVDELAQASSTRRVSAFSEHLILSLRLSREEDASVPVQLMIFRLSDMSNRTEVEVEVDSRSERVMEMEGAEQSTDSRFSLLLCSHHSFCTGMRESKESSNSRLKHNDFKTLPTIRRSC